MEASKKTGAVEAVEAAEQAETSRALPNLNLNAIRKLSDAELAAALKHIAGNPNLPRRPHPQPPDLRCRGQISPMWVKTKLKEIQKFISSFEYNHTGVNYVKKRRDRGQSHVMVTAKELIREALPIQCVEAVFIALYLTAELKSDEVTTFPLSFKSVVGGHCYRHIVLAVAHRDKWGALGISRCSSLMYKELTFGSLAALVREYRDSYEKVCHQLLKVYVGLPFATNLHANGPVKWRALSLDLTAAPSASEGQDKKDEGWAARCARFAKDGRKIVEHYNRTGSLPDEYQLAAPAPAAPSTLLTSKGGKKKQGGGARAAGKSGGGDLGDEGEPPSDEEGSDDEPRSPAAGAADKEGGGHGGGGSTTEKSHSRSPKKEANPRVFGV